MPPNSEDPNGASSSTSNIAARNDVSNDVQVQFDHDIGVVHADDGDGTDDALAYILEDSSDELNDDLEDYLAEHNRARAKEHRHKYAANVGQYWADLHQIMVDYLVACETVGDKRCLICKAQQAEYRCVSCFSKNPSSSFMCASCVSTHMDLCHMIVDRKGALYDDGRRVSIGRGGDNSFNTSIPVMLIDQHGWQEVSVIASAHGGFVGSLMKNFFFPSAPKTPSINPPNSFVKHMLTIFHYV